MINVTTDRRLLGLAASLVVAYLALAGWLAYVQLGEHQSWLKLALANTQHKQVRPARRGAILDIQGNLLATSVPVKAVCADPTLLGTNQALVAHTLAPLLQLREIDLFQQLQPRFRTNAEHKVVTNAYVLLRHRLPLDQWLQVTQAMANLFPQLNLRRLPQRQASAVLALRHKAIFAQEEELRQYPSHAMAAQVLGFVSSEERETDQGRVFETHGLSGVELTLDRPLSGAVGWSKPGEEVEARPGLDVVLTLDAGIQNIAEWGLDMAVQEHNPLNAAVIVVRPKTGEILALANRPTFDPNRLADFPPAALRDRAISDPTEPGSTFKVPVVSRALDAGAVTLQDQFDCEQGHFTYAGRLLHDHARYGVLTVQGILTKSSNIGAAKIAIRLGPQRLYQAIRDFGFGQPTGIPLPEESRGLVRDLSTWQKSSILSLPMGHEILATPLQMVMAVAAVANEGRLMRPKLIDRLQDETGHTIRQFQPELVRQVVSPATARLMITALKTVVSPEGTAAKAKLDHYTVAGKTGTTQKFANGTYNSGKYFSSFIGFFPADHPELCISVVLNEPEVKTGHFGGEIAAPVFKLIAERVANYLRLPPESPAPSEPTPELKDAPVYAGKTATPPNTASVAKRDPN